MQWGSARLAARLAGRREDRSTPLWALSAFVVGAVAGWMLGEKTGGVSRARVRSYLHARKASRPDPDAPASPRGRVRAALDGDPELALLDVIVIPAGRSAVELHGWVPSRRLRARATRLAATAAAPLRLVDSLLVRGEDDRPAGEDDRPATSLQTA